MTQNQWEVFEHLFGATVWFLELPQPISSDPPKIDLFSQISDKLKNLPDFLFYKSEAEKNLYKSIESIKGPDRLYYKTLILRKPGNYGIVSEANEMLKDLGLPDNFIQLQLTFYNENQEYVSRDYIDLVEVFYSPKEVIEIAKRANVPGLDILVINNTDILHGQLGMTRPVYEIVEAKGKLNRDVKIIE
jgi:hypothetical protein